MERVAITGLIIILVLTLVWFRWSEKYTEEQSDSLFSSLSGRYRGVDMDNIRKYTIKSILSVDIGDDSSAALSNVNLLVDTLNSNGFTFTHFSDMNELNTMFETAYTSGESGLATRERIILRSFASPCVNITLQFSKAAPYSYTSEGVPDFTSTIVSESGKTTKEMLQYCFTVLDKLFSAAGTTRENPYTPEMIDYINSTIPSKYTQKFDRTDNMSIPNAITSPTPNETALWFIKAILIGPAYIARTAENKWKLDLSWTP
jgi:hypothetical protein